MPWPGAERATVFLATPHEASLEIVPQLLNAGLRVVDLSGAFRFTIPQTFADWLQIACAAKRIWLKRLCTALPELYADQLPDARLVANPGCYPTSVILGLRPLVESGWIAPSGHCRRFASPARRARARNRRKKLHFAEVDENFRAYGLFSHRTRRKSPTTQASRAKTSFFTTHMLPVARGILSTLYVWFAEPHAAEEVESLYRAFYADRPMMRIVAGRKTSGAAACGAHEFLRYRVCARSRGAAPRGRELSRQSGLRAPRARRFRT